MEVGEAIEIHDVKFRVVTVAVSLLEANIRLHSYGASILCAG